jgi:Protein of unknown function (DUF669)
MASLGATYDASQGEQMSDRSALPPGEYLAAIAKSDVGPTKKGDGRKIDLEFEVLDGAHKGRRFWTTLNLWNPNPVAVEIAQRELNSICHAVGKLRVADTDELHGVPMKVTLGVEKDGRNVARGYKPAAGAPPSAPASTGRHADTTNKRGPWA